MLKSPFDKDILFQQLTTIFNTNEYLLNNKLLLKYPQARDWCDFAIIKRDDNDFPIPVTIKVSKLDKNDNLNCKLGIYYAYWVFIMLQPAYCLTISQIKHLEEKFFKKYTK